MMTDSAWTLTSLVDVLPDALEGEAAIEAGDGVLTLRFPEHGDLAVSVTVSGSQILASTLLWPRADEKDPAAFEEKLLRTHKLLPLSTFGITEIGGQDWYELFGALSAKASLEEVVTELRVLAQNAVDIAEAQLGGE